MGVMFFPLLDLEDDFRIIAAFLLLCCSLFAFSWTIMSLIKLPLSTATFWYSKAEVTSAGDLLVYGVCGGVTSRDSSKTGAKSSSSEMMKEVDLEALYPHEG